MRLSRSENTGRNIQILNRKVTDFKMGKNKSTKNDGVTGKGKTQKLETEVRLPKGMKTPKRTPK